MHHCCVPNCAEGAVAVWQPASAYCRNAAGSFCGPAFSTRYGVDGDKERRSAELTLPRRRPGQVKVGVTRHLFGTQTW